MINGIDFNKEFSFEIEYKKMEKVTIKEGVFSKIYNLKNNRKKCIVYITPLQSILTLDDSSAEVWQLIYNNNGVVANAYNYILKNGKFEKDKEIESKKVLHKFIEELTKLNLIEGGNVIHSKIIVKPEMTVNERVNPLVNTELSISQIMADNHIFYNLVLELTYRCNEQCIHCYCPSNRYVKEMPLNVILNLLNQFSQLGGFKVQLTGGEIFLRRDIEDILKYLINQNLVVDLTSNLTLMTDNIFDIIRDIHPRSIGCSIYSARSELHDYTTGLIGSFKKSISSIEKIRSYGIPVVIKTPLMSHTASFWKEIENLANELGCDYQFDLNITAKNDGGKEPIEYRVKDVNILNEIMSSRFYKLYMNDEPTNLSPSLDANLCGAGANGLTISPDGFIRPCIGLIKKLGVFPDNSLEGIWKNSEFQKEWSSKKLVDIEICSKCKKIAFCNHCPGAWQAENGRYDIPSGYTCFLADIWSKARMNN